MSNVIGNVFDDETLDFMVLVNDQKQHSLWPKFKIIPQGWEPVFGPSSRSECIDYVETHWSDIRP